ncbi:MAG: hypothetical protein J4215_03135 [Candidatus Diapherotrites archaeon]|uniref:Uncharacterized protein n=1 Tax=Candidatus Iainarchaeum sp. TaxID=3101447 RepID=A0A8T4L9Z8_9ARCH|nr:hypothetical protein [Candidatus Diapherotrites archaeon]
MGSNPKKKKRLSNDGKTIPARSRPHLAKDGTKTDFEKPTLKDMVKVYDQWVEAPGAITIRWRKNVRSYL